MSFSLSVIDGELKTETSNVKGEKDHRRKFGGGAWGAKSKILSLCINNNILCYIKFDF